MTNASTEERTLDLFKDHFGLDSRPALTATLDDMDADSLDLLELILQIEEEFRVEIPPDVRFETPADVVGWLQGQGHA